MFDHNNLPIAILGLNLLDLLMSDPGQLELGAQKHNLTGPSLLIQVFLDPLFHLVQDYGRIRSVRQLVVLESEEDLDGVFLDDLEKHFYSPFGDRQVWKGVREFAHEFVDRGGRGDEFG
jgi:hypothetical protein